MEAALSERGERAALLLVVRHRKLLRSREAVRRGVHVCHADRQLQRLVDALDHVRLPALHVRAVHHGQQRYPFGVGGKLVVLVTIVLERHVLFRRFLPHVRSWAVSVFVKSYTQQLHLVCRWKIRSIGSHVVH